MAWFAHLAQQLLPASQSPAKNNPPTTGFLSAWQFNLYNKSDGNLSEFQRVILSYYCQTYNYIHSLFLSIPWAIGHLCTNARLCYIYIAFPAILCVHKQLPWCDALLLYLACLQLQTFTLWYLSIQTSNNVASILGLNFLIAKDCWVM